MEAGISQRVDSLVEKLSMSKVGPKKPASVSLVFEFDPLRKYAFDVLFTFLTYKSI